MQATSVNKSKPAAQGYAPETGTHSGNHHDTGMAGAVPATLELVAQELRSNQPSTGLTDAINAGQSALGNRSFMQFVGAAQQQARAPDADSGNDPLQMMWPNKAMRGLPSLTGMSALRPGRTAQKRPEPRRNVSLSPQFNAWDKDILFGPTNSHTLHLAIKQEAAPDSPIPLTMFRQLDKSLPRCFPAGYLWSGKGFKFADRELLSRRDRPYMDYVREAITAAVTRGGDIYWALGRLYFDKVFSDLFRVRMEHGKDPVEYMAKVSYPDLMDKHGRYIDADTGQVVAEPPLNVQGGDTSELEEFEEFHRLVELGRIKAVTPFQPLITTVEIIGFLMGDERKYLDRTSFFDARHREADRKEFLSAFSGVLDRLLNRQAEIGPENDFTLEPEVYRPLDLYSGYPCGQCEKVFRVDWELEEHWHSFPDHRPGVAPGADGGNDPLQMMWPNLGRRALSPVLSASVLRPGGAPGIRPGSVPDQRLNPRRYVWDKDILFGIDNVDTLGLAIKLEASTDSPIDRPRFRNFDKTPPPGFSSGHLWGKPAYGFADRKKLGRRDLPYMAYPREAIATSMERGGNIYWALGHLDFDTVFAELFRVETEYGTDPVRYMAEVSFPELMEKHGKYIDARTGEELTMPQINLSDPIDSDLEAVEKFDERLKNGEIKNIRTFQPLITTTEIIGFLMGDERKYLDKTSFFDARHRETDRAGFVSAFSGVLDQLLARKPEIGPDNEYKLEAQVYRPLDWYTGYPCGQCNEIFKVERELEEHWKSFPHHRP